MTQVPPATPESSPPPVVPVCYRHPKRETYVRCTRCDRPICPDCMNEASVGHQCPECVAEGRRTAAPDPDRVRRHRRSAARGYVTKALIAINVAVLVVSAAAAPAGAACSAAGSAGCSAAPRR